MTHDLFALTGFTRVNDCEDILGNDAGCFNGVSSHMEGNDEVGLWLHVSG